MDDMKTLSARVKGILEKYPQTRNSDDMLYVKIVETYDSNALNRPFFEVMVRMGELSIPHYESVSRARRKMQEQHPELSAIPEVEYEREKNEKAFRDYAIYGG